MLLLLTVDKVVFLTNLPFRRSAAGGEIFPNIIISLKLQYFMSLKRYTQDGLGRYKGRCEGLVVTQLSHFDDDLTSNPLFKFSCPT